MQSFWMPKKQPLYAPMLSTFGGGSARGFGAGLSGGAVEDVSSIIKDFTWNSGALNGASAKESRIHRPSGNCEGFCVTNDGTRLIIFDYSSDIIWQYQLSTAGNPASSSSSSTTIFDLSSGSYGGNTRGGRFNPDGDILYVAGQYGFLVFNYNQSSYTVSLSSYTTYQTWSGGSTSLGANPRGLLYNPNPSGHEILIQDASNQRFIGVPVNGTTLDTSATPTIYNVQNADSPYFDGNYFTSSVIVNDGNDVLVGTQNGRIGMYSMSTAYDFSSLSSTPTDYITNALGNDTQQTRDLYINDSGQVFSSYSSQHKITRWTN